MARSAGWTSAAAVRAPGRPTCWTRGTLVEQVNAVVLTGGSAYGLAAADGVMAGLERTASASRSGPEPGQVVPIVPAAVIFDLGRGGTFGHRPTAEFGARAYWPRPRPSARPPAASAPAPGPTCGGLKGGFGYAERQPRTTAASVGAAVVVNATGSPVDPATGRLWADRAAAAARPRPTPSATALAAAYAQAAALAGHHHRRAAHRRDPDQGPGQPRWPPIGHDGMARAIAPVHSMLDGDTVFAWPPAAGRAPDDPRRPLVGFNRLLAAAADMFTDACLDALLAADGRGPGRYRELAPSPSRLRIRRRPGAPSYTVGRHTVATMTRTP